MPRAGASTALGEEFALLGAARDGDTAERLAVPKRNGLHKPEVLSFAEAAAVPVVFVTAWHMLMARAALQPGEWV